MNTRWGFLREENKTIFKTYSNINFERNILSTNFNYLI